MNTLKDIAIAFAVVVFLSFDSVAADPGPPISDGQATEPQIEELPTIVPLSYMPEMALYSLFCDDADVMLANIEQAGGVLVVRSDSADETDGVRYYHNFLTNAFVLTMVNSKDPTRECVITMGGAKSSTILIDHTVPEFQDPCTLIHPMLSYDDGKCSMPLVIPGYDPSPPDESEMQRQEMEDELHRLFKERGLNGAEQ